VRVFDVDGGVELTHAVIGHVVRSTDRVLIATVADRLQTLSNVEVVAHAAFQVLSTSTVQTIRHHLPVTIHPLHHITANKL